MLTRFLHFSSLYESEKYYPYLAFGDLLFLRLGKVSKKDPIAD